jgi:hypothetical protein
VCFPPVQKASYSSQLVAWARYIISFLVEASDNKVRVAGQDSRPPPTPCPFPDHEAGCANAPLAAGLHLEEMCEGAPVLVIERENDKVSMCLLSVMLADLGVRRVFIRGIAG